jgi:hypothetical protein
MFLTALLTVFVNFFLNFLNVFKCSCLYLYLAVFNFKTLFFKVKITKQYKVMCSRLTPTWNTFSVCDSCVEIKGRFLYPNKTPLVGTDHNIKKYLDYYVLDLTNTTKYYDPIVLDEGHYLKVPMGKDAFLSSLQFEEIYNFIESTPSKSKILIHCTNGINRTGYVLCSYLKHRGISGKEALDSFKKIRGHPMTDQPYIDIILYETKQESLEIQALQEATKNFLQEGHSLYDKTEKTFLFKPRPVEKKIDARIENFVQSGKALTKWENINPEISLEVITTEAESTKILLRKEVPSLQMSVDIGLQWS